MMRGYNRYVYPKSEIVTSSSFGWLQDHSDQDYYLLSNFAAGSWSQMPGIKGIHALIDSGSHRYSDRTNQLYYYTFFSPATFRIVVSKLQINSIIVGSNNIGWASALNASPDWRLAQIRLDSQLYLRRDNQGVDLDRKLFSDWEGGVLHDAATGPEMPLAASSEQILRGLGLRPDAVSLKILMTSSDSGWATDPQISYLQDWLHGVPDRLIAEAVDNPSYAENRSSMAARILLLLRLQRYQEAANIAGEWHPTFFDLGYHDTEMLRAEAFLEGGDLKRARKILDSFWPQPRYSLRWAKLCQKVYADDPGAMPKDARLLSGLADQLQWQEDMIDTLNQNIHSLSSR